MFCYKEYKFTKIKGKYWLYGFLYENLVEKVGYCLLIDDWVGDRNRFLENIMYFCTTNQFIQMAKKSNVLIKNKRATFDYEILDRYVAGIQLFGTEIKSIRDGKVSLVDSYCTFIENELWVKNMNISTYFFGTYNNHEPRRDRKLLLNRKELDKLLRETKETANTIVPIKLFINDKGLAKLEIGLARGKKMYDKRQSLRAKEDRREIDRAKKEWL